MKFANFSKFFPASHLTVDYGGMPSYQTGQKRRRDARAPMSRRTTICNFIFEVTSQMVHGST